MQNLKRENYGYQPYYCEENIWHLCQLPEFHGSDVLVIAAEAEFFPMCRQRAAANADDVVFWDYHVVLLWYQQARPYIVDFDTRLDFCTPLAFYLQHSFLSHIELLPQFVPWFRLLNAQQYVTDLKSDRSHMRNGATWLAEPPPWSVLSCSSNLSKFTQLQDTKLGVILSAQQLLNLAQQRAQLS